MTDFVKQHVRYSFVSQQLKPWPSLVSKDVIDDKADACRLSLPRPAVESESLFRTVLSACSPTHLDVRRLCSFAQDDRRQPQKLFWCQRAEKPLDGWDDPRGECVRVEVFPDRNHLCLNRPSLVEDEIPWVNIERKRSDAGRVGLHMFRSRLLLGFTVLVIELGCHSGPAGPTRTPARDQPIATFSGDWQGGATWVSCNGAPGNCGDTARGNCPRQMSLVPPIPLEVSLTQEVDGIRGTVFGYPITGALHGANVSPDRVQTGTVVASGPMVELAPNRFAGIEEFTATLVNKARLRGTVTLRLSIPGTALSTPCGSQDTVRQKFSFDSLSRVPPE